MTKRKSAPLTEAPPSRANGSDTWRGRFGEAVVKRGIPPPEPRSLQADIFWLLDNVLQVGECMDITRSFETLRTYIAAYNKTRGVPHGGIKVRAIGDKSRVWKLQAGYEKPDP